MLKLQADESFFELRQTFCGLPQTKLIFNSWGEVSMCCHQLTQIGKINEDTNILDIWNSPLAKEIRQRTEQGQLHPVCKSWNSCPFIVKDKMMFPHKIYKNSIYPMYLEICLPDKHCNVGGESPTVDNPACLMCRRNFDIPQQPDLTELMCEKAMPLMPYLRYLCVLGIAEPFWKDAVFKIFDKLEFHRFKDQIEFTTNTNGTCLNDKTIKQFFDATTMSDIAWSIDGASAYTHQKLRRLNTYDLVVRNLKHWIELRDEYGGKEKHKVCIYNNINMINVHEMTAMVNMAHAIGVDKMIMLPTYDQSGVISLGDLMMNEKNLSVFKRHSEAAMTKANELNFKLIYSKRFDIVPPPMGTPESPVELVQLSLT